MYRANSGSTGNPASFGSLAGNVLTIPATNMRAGADISCTFTNTALSPPTITLSKISNGGVGSFDFSGTNGFANQTITTATSGVAVAGSLQTLAARHSDDHYKTIPSGYALTGITVQD